jgi:Leucine rich repeat/Leucine Rich repeats (2 copies)
LRLTKNQITTLQKNAFIEFTNVEKIHLDGNLLSIIDFNEFRKTSKLTYLDVGFNQITVIQPFLDSTNIEITILQIHNNDLTDISPLCNLKKLKELNLSRNRGIEFITTTTTFKFNCWSELGLLFLTDTGLKKLDHNYLMLDGCNNLYYLNLMDNDLGMICFGQFPELLAMTQLNIRNNSLTDLDVLELKRKFKKLTDITTTGNKWTCGYYQQTLKTKLEENKLIEKQNYAPAHEKNCLEGTPFVADPEKQYCPKLQEATPESKETAAETTIAETEKTLDPETEVNHSETDKISNDLLNTEHTEPIRDETSDSTNAEANLGPQENDVQSKQLELKETGKDKNAVLTFSFWVLTIIDCFLFLTVLVLLGYYKL